jgi:hypothetical protein
MRLPQKPSRRFWTLVAVALLPLLFLRALVPAGFMASAVDGGVRVTFCGSDGAPTDKHAPTGDGHCLFAHSAGAAPWTTAPHVSASVDPLVNQSPRPGTDPKGLPGPLRTHGSRAPPHVSLA